MTPTTTLSTDALDGTAAPRRFAQGIADLLERYRPSRHPYFRRLAAAPIDLIRQPKLLGEIYLHYQAAMHSTRAMVYLLPHLDRPSLRVRKCRIYQDDDGLPGGDTHHHQLARAFRNVGAALPLPDDDFGDLDDLARRVGGTTGELVLLVQRLYPRSLGPWCIVELLSDDWMRALAAALGTHFPAMRAEPYFADVFAGGVEERHGQEALDITSLVLAGRPQLLEETLAGAHAMAEMVGAFWTGLDRMLPADRA